VVINKGQREGAYDGQPVVDAGGVVGQLVHVGPFSSTVLLISDPSHALPVQVNRNGLRAVAVGSGQDNALLLEYLPTNSDIREGDLIVSSGLGRRFPSGYPVGNISAIKLEPGEPFAKVTVTPSARLGRSREVLLLWPQEQDQAAESAGVALNP
ncbi:MAG: rod shape-determining protein MreC, partial [Longimicrobiales bacterium]